MWFLSAELPSNSKYKHLKLKLHVVVWGEMTDSENNLLLTVNNMAGRGVYLVLWIMEKKPGRWPSLAPTKNSLKNENPKKSTLGLNIALQFTVY